MNRLVVVVVSVAVVFHHVIALISKPITVSVKSSYNCVENYQNANYRGNSFSVHANSYIDSQSYSQCHSRSYSNSFGNSYDNNRITKLHSSLQPKDDFITSKQSLLRYKLHLLSVHVRNTLSYPKRKLIDTKNKLQHFFTNQLPMLHYLWPKDDFRLKSFLILSLVAMFLGKWFNIKVPFILQRTIDTISQTASVSNSVAGSITKSATNPSINVLSTASIAILYYGLSRALSVIFSEIKTCLFTNVSQNVLRKFANEIFTHLHSLDSQFHLRTPSGVVSVAYVRAIRGFQGFMFQLIFSVLPTILELFLVSKILYTKFGMIFTMITLLTFISYLSFTIFITQWRVEMRQEIVDIDNQRNGFFIDSILNHEIVKLFTNEQKESKRFDSYLKKLEELAINNTYAIALLNLGQAVLFSIGLTASLFVALRKVNSGVMSIGDLVAINSMLLQLAIPFNFMGYTCK